MICFSSSLLERDLHYFSLSVLFLFEQVRNEISILKKNIHFESVGKEEGRGEVVKKIMSTERRMEKGVAYLQ